MLGDNEKKTSIYRFILLMSIIGATSALTFFNNIYATDFKEIIIFIIGLISGSAIPKQNEK